MEQENSRENQTNNEEAAVQPTRVTESRSLEAQRNALSFSGLQAPDIEFVRYDSATRVGINTRGVIEDRDDVRQLSRRNIEHAMPEPLIVSIDSIRTNQERGGEPVPQQSSCS